MGAIVGVRVEGADEGDTTTITLIRASAFNLGLWMRRLFRIGTPVSYA